LRGLPLLERKRLLRCIVPQSGCHVRYVEHVTERGVDLFAGSARRTWKGSSRNGRTGCTRRTQPRG
jgi:hypothetical protein